MKSKFLSFGLVILVLIISGFIFMKNRKSAFMQCYESTGWVQLGDTSQPTCGGYTANAEDVKKIYDQ